MTHAARDGRLALASGAVVALAYLAAPLVTAPVIAIAAWKAAGILLFALYALRRGARFLALALFFSAIGDVMLALAPPRWELGMAAFGAAHLVYLAIFIRILRRDGPGRFGPMLAAAILAASLAMLVWFFADMGALRAPGLAYQAIITAMAAAAFASRAPASARIGAALFMASDTLIALGLYKGLPPIPGAIWLSYAGAQFLLAFGLSRAPSGISRT